MKKKTRSFLPALLLLALAFSLFTPGARAADGSEPVYCPYWRQYTGCAYLPETETATRKWGETVEYRFEYELLRGEDERVTEIVGRKYDGDGTLVEERTYNGHGWPVRVTAYRDGQAVETSELSYRFDGIMYYALAQERTTDLLTGEVRTTEYYQTGRGSAVAVRDGERPDFSFDPETRQIDAALWWEDPIASVSVLDADGTGGRIWEGMKQTVSWPYEGTVCTALWYERLPDGTRGALLSTHYEVRSWFDGPYYVLHRDFTGADEESEGFYEDFYSYDSAVNCVRCWVHRDGGGEVSHLYSFLYYDGSDLKESEFLDEFEWEDGVELKEDFD